MPTILKRARVDLDLAHHFSYIAQDKIEPADRLLIVAAESFERLAAMPAIGTTWKSPRIHLKGIRFYPLPSPYRSYLVFYLPIKDGVEILAILHGAQSLEDAIAAAIE